MVFVHTLIDDVGSFPLPASISRDVFDKAYVQARQAMIAGHGVRESQFLLVNFCAVVADSFRKKSATGLDVVNYPQHYDMHKQVTDEIYRAMDDGSYLVDERRAIIPEVNVITDEAKKLCEEFGKRVLLRVSITGPLESYLKVVGTTAHSDVLMMFAETVRRFAKNSLRFIQ